jgi:hypothetical protein
MCGMVRCYNLIDMGMLTQVLQSVRSLEETLVRTILLVVGLDEMSILTDLEANAISDPSSYLWSFAVKFRKIRSN